MPSKLITALAGKGSINKHCAVVTPDEENVFKSANSNLIKRSLTAIGVPSCLVIAVSKYLTGSRQLSYDTGNIPWAYTVTLHVP